MTPEETQAEIKSLREQVLQLRQQQEDQKKHWFRWGQIASFIVLALAIVALIVIYRTGSGVGAVTLLFAWAGVGGFLSSAFGHAGRPPAHLSFWSHLTWGWSGRR